MLRSCTEPWKTDSWPVNKTHNVSHTVQPSCLANGFIDWWCAFSSTGKNSWSLSFIWAYCFTNPCIYIYIHIFICDNEHSVCIKIVIFVCIQWPIQLNIYIYIYIYINVAAVVSEDNNIAQSHPDWNAALLVEDLCVYPLGDKFAHYFRDLWFMFVSAGETITWYPFTIWASSLIRYLWFTWNKTWLSILMQLCILLYWLRVDIWIRTEIMIWYPCTV